jgi:hypothetical protein
MEITRLDGHLLKNFLDSGMLEVTNHKGYINAINVFPVADGDTGTNLSRTLKAMSEKSQVTDSFSMTASSISQSGLAHARGNSGIIFVSYINGLALESGEHETVGLEEFAHMAHGAVAYAYGSIENPVEGTMISVIRDWADYLVSNYMHFKSFNGLFASAYTLAEQSLHKTTDMLEVLKHNKVVDAGAAGFVGFLRGINLFLKNQILPLLISEEAYDVEIHSDEEDSSYRYCTEAFLEGVTISAVDLKAKIKHLGDSLIVTRMGNQMRIHLHTDQPAELYKRIKPYGLISEQKVDDMAMQKNVRMQTHKPLAILTDSIADITDALKLKDHIHTLPLTITVDEVDYLDKQTIELEQVFEAMVSAKDYPTSALPAPGRIEEKLIFLLENYERILVISVSSNLSGTYSAFKKVAEKLDPLGKRIVVFDSLLNSGAQGLLVSKAAALRAAGHSLEEIVAVLENTRKNTKIYVCLESIRYAIKSGRVPRTLGKIAMILGARPIMTLDALGKGGAFGVGFSKKQMTQKILKIISKTQESNGIESYSIVHADNLTLAKSYELALTEIIGFGPSYITEISTVTAIHSGIGSVAVSIIEK